MPAKLPEMQEKIPTEKIPDAAETEEEVLKLEVGPLDALRVKRKKHLPVVLMAAPPHGAATLRAA